MRTPDERGHVQKLRLTTDLGRALFLDVLRSLADSPGNSRAVEEYMKDAADLIEALAAERTATGGEEPCDDVVRRRFGPGFAKPCHRPEIVECAAYECQSINRCRFAPAAPDKHHVSPGGREVEGTAAAEGSKGSRGFESRPGGSAPDKAQEEVGEPTEAQKELAFDIAVNWYTPLEPFLPKSVHPHLYHLKRAIAAALSRAHASGREEGERASAAFTAEPEWLAVGEEDGTLHALEFRVSPTRAVYVGTISRHTFDEHELGEVFASDFGWFIIMDEDGKWRPVGQARDRESAEEIGRLLAFGLRCSIAKAALPIPSPAQERAR